MPGGRDGGNTICSNDIIQDCLLLNMIAGKKSAIFDSDLRKA